MRGTMGCLSEPDDRGIQLPANEVHISTGGVSDRACEVGLVLYPGSHPVQ